MDFDYSSFLNLKDVGDRGLKELSFRRVAVIGLGGIGSWSFEFLVRSGVKKFLLIDGDKVEKKNLLRQNYSFGDIGNYKAEVLKNRYDLDIEILKEFLSVENKEVLRNVDLILDCTDNMDARFLIDKISKEFKVPWIFGSALEYKSMAKFIDSDSEFRYESIFKGKKEYARVEKEGIFIGANVFAALLQVKLAVDYFLKDKVSDNLYYMDFKEMKFYGLERG